jgi:multiple sugar transport system substrate-binding protein
MRIRPIIVTLAAAVLLVAACGAPEGGADGGGGRSITYWTLFNTPDRMAAQERLAARFTEQTGIAVEIVGLAYNDMNQSMVSGAASGDVPDVVLHNQDQAVEWSAQGLLDVDAAGATLDRLGRDTFNPRALEVISVDGQPVTVPSDAWGQMLFYRKDVFQRAGLAPPRTLDDVVAAARALNSADMAGIVLGTKPGDSYTNQNLEWLALLNGCRLTSEADPAQPTLESPECVGALRYYQQLAASSLPGAQDVSSTRATYLAGKAAMISWSPHLLDEIAGQDSNFPPSCPECAQNPAFIAENTGILPVIEGSGGDGDQFGQTLNLGILRNGETEAAQRFVEFMMSEGYTDSIGIGAEGRFPVRLGPQAGSEEYVQAWAKLPIGPNPGNSRSITEIYGPDVVPTIQQGVADLGRLGFGYGAERLGSALATQGTLTRELEPLFQGADPAQVAATMNESAAQVARDVAG